MITTVTITGADDSINPQQLANLSKAFPFAEWGILKGNQTKPRFPTNTWTSHLSAVYKDNPHMTLSLHLCGDLCREALNGNRKILSDIPQWRMFNRVQFNIPQVANSINLPNLYSFISDHPEKQFIFQINKKTEGFLGSLIGFKKAGLNVAILYDCSGGKGIHITEFKLPHCELPTGYAGGIDNTNLVSGMKQVDGFSGEIPVWIDAETAFRTKHVNPDASGYLWDDERFDLNKVMKFLNTANTFMKKRSSKEDQKGTPLPQNPDIQVERDDKEEHTEKILKILSESTKLVGSLITLGKLNKELKEQKEERTKDQVKMPLESGAEVRKHLATWLTEDDKDVKPEGFTLVRKDITSARTICYWISENIETAPAEKLMDALQQAIKHRDTEGQKWPD